VAEEKQKNVCRPGFDANAVGEESKGTQLPPLKFLRDAVDWVSIEVER
jgi:hypothetical protein